MREKEKEYEKELYICNINGIHLGNHGGCG